MFLPNQGGYRPPSFFRDPSLSTSPFTPIGMRKKRPPSLLSAPEPLAPLGTHQAPEAMPQIGSVSAETPKLGLMARLGSSIRSDPLTLLQMAAGMAEGAKPGGNLASGFQGMVDGMAAGRERGMQEEQFGWNREQMNRQRKDWTRGDQQLEQARAQVRTMSFADPAERAFAEANPLEYLQAKGMPIGRADQAKLDQGERELTMRGEEAKATREQAEAHFKQQMALGWTNAENSARANNYDRSMQATLGRTDAGFVAERSKLYADAQRTYLPMLDEMDRLVTEYPELTRMVVDPNVKNTLNNLTRTDPDKATALQRMLAIRNSLTLEAVAPLRPVTDLDWKAQLEVAPGPSLTADAVRGWTAAKRREIDGAGREIAASSKWLQQYGSLQSPNEKGQTFYEALGSRPAPAPVTTETAKGPPPPRRGEVRDGYRFIGNPNIPSTFNDPKSWVKVEQPNGRRGYNR